MKYSFVFLITFFVLSSALMLSAASAAELEYYGIETDIERNLQMMITVTLTPTSPVNHLDYNPGFSIFNLSATTRSGTSNCDLGNVKDGSEISCDFYGMMEGETMIRLAFSTREGIKPMKNGYEFRAEFPVPMPAERAFSLIKLPPKAVLSEEIVNQSFFPPDGSTLTDGKRMMISWEMENLTESDTLSFSTIFEVVGDGGTMWDITVMVMTSVVVIVMIIVAIYLRRGSSPKEGEVRVLPLLNKDEKRVVDIIAKNDGEARQSRIVKESDYSKAKISRLIKNLKERGVVDTEPISGRENKVILKIKGVE